MCSRMDCILGPHCSHKPWAMRTTESAVRSRSAKTRASSRLMPGAPLLVGQVYEIHLVDDLLGHPLQDVRHQVGVGVYDDDGVVVPPGSLLQQQVLHDVQHQGGLAHAGAGHVEVVAVEGVLLEVDFLGPAAGRVSHVGSAGPGPGRWMQHPGTGAGYPGQLVSPAQGMPQGSQLPRSQDVAGLQHTPRWWEWLGGGNRGPRLPGLEAGPGGVVVTLVGQGGVAQQFPGPVLAAVLGEDGDDLQLGLVGDARSLLLNQQRVPVLAPGEGLPYAPPGPARQGQRRRRAQAQQHRLPGLAVLNPEVAPESHEGHHPQHGQGHPVLGVDLGLGVLGVVGRVGPLPAFRLLLVVAGPLRPQREQL